MSKTLSTPALYNEIAATLVHHPDGLTNNELRVKVIPFLTARGFSVTPQSIRSRVVEMSRTGAVRKADSKRRCAVTGRTAGVWVRA